MFRQLRHRQTKGAANSRVGANITAPHLDSTLINSVSKGNPMRSFEGQKHALDGKIHRDEMRMRGRELRLKITELRQQRSARFTSIAVAIIAATSAFIGGAAVAVIQGINNKDIEKQKNKETYNLETFKAQHSYDLEKLKAKQNFELEKAKDDHGYDLEDKKLASTLIAKAGETKDILDVVARLRFWIKLELIPKRLEASLDQELNQDPTLLFASRDASFASSAIVTSPAGVKPQDTDEMKSYRRRIQTRPADTDALIYLGFALYKQNRLPEALDPLQMAVRINPSSQWGLYNLALVEFANNRADAGEAALTNLLRLAPQFVATIRKHRQFDRFSPISKYVEKLLVEPAK